MRLLLSSTCLRACTRCDAMCGLIVGVVGDRIASVRGDEQDPLSQGWVCPRVGELRATRMDLERVRRPLRRTASGWTPVSWDEALDEAAGRLHAIQVEHGADAVATYLGRPTARDPGALLFAPMLLGALRSRNFSASVDQLPRMLSAHLMFGHPLLVPVPDLDRTQYLLILGANPAVSEGSIPGAPGVRSRIEAIRRRGGTVVVVDPRRSETASLADEHVFIRPGTDALFLLAILHEVATYAPRLRRVAGLADGVDTLRAAVREFTPARAEPHTGIPAEVTCRLARAFLAAPRAVAYGGAGACTQAFGGLCQWAITALNAVTGNLDREGGAMFTLPAFDVVRGPSLLAASRGGFGRWRTRVRGLPELAGQLPIAALAEEILADDGNRVRALLTIAGNPVLSTPNGTRLVRALGALEFMVSIAAYVDETSRQADLVLPPAMPLERGHYEIALHALAIRNTARYSPPVVAPPRGALPVWRILLELHHRIARLRGGRWVAEALRYRALQRIGPEGLLDLGLRMGPYGGGLNPLRGMSLRALRASPHGVDLGPLRPCLPERLARDQRVALAPAPFLADLERLRRTFRADEVRGERGLLLVGERNRWEDDWRIPDLPIGARQTLLMHPLDARARDVADGDEVIVSSRVGRLAVKVRITDEVMSGVVSLRHGHGHDAEGRLDTGALVGASADDLTDDAVVDALSGSTVLSGVPVAVWPAGRLRRA